MLKAIHKFGCSDLNVFQNHLLKEMRGQNCAYSRCGLTKVVYSFLKRSQSRNEKLCLIKSTIVLAFFTFSDICSELKAESTLTPRSFSTKTCSSSCPLILYL